MSESEDETDDSAVKVAAAQHLLDQARVDLHEMIGQQEALVIGINMAAEQVQEKRLDLLDDPKSVKLAEVIFTVLLAAGLEFKIVGRALQGFLGVAGKRLQGFAQAKAASAVVKRVNLPVFNFDGRLGPWTPREIGTELTARVAHSAPVRVAQRAQIMSANLGIHLSKIDYDAWNSLAKAAQKGKKALDKFDAPGAGPRGTSAPWPADLIYSNQFDPATRQPRRLIQPGFDPGAGATVFSVRLRRAGETHLSKMKAAVRAVVDDLQWRIDQARARAAGVSAAAVNEILESEEGPYFPQDDQDLGVDPDVLLEDARDLLQRVTTGEPPLQGATLGGTVPALSSTYTHLDALTELYAVAYEKVFWMALVGSDLAIFEPTKPTIGDPVDDRREIFSYGIINQKLVKYWWARFSDPETGRPFKSQFLLFRHLADIRETLRELNRKAEAPPDTAPAGG
jgi:hypothetical protein